MGKEEIIITVISAILGSGIINILITHILYKNKLRKENKIKGNDMIAKEIAESLRFARNLELEIDKQEIYDIDKELAQRGSQLNLFDSECIYPEIFNDWNSYNSFIEKIQEIRKCHEKNLSCKIALNIVFIDKYTRQLSLFMSDHGNEEMLPFWGALFIFDLQKWQSRMDKMLVREINKYIYKLESHKGIKWKLERKLELERQYRNTILYYLLNGKCRRKDKKRMEFIKNYLEKVVFDETE